MPAFTTPDQPEQERFQCRHIFTAGHRCGSPCLRGAVFCFYHHTSRRPPSKEEKAQRESRAARLQTFELPLPEDRAAIQLSIGEVLRRLASNGIDPRRAGLLLYGLQIASLNLPKQAAQPPASETVEQATLDPELGLLAPPAPFGTAPRQEKSLEQILMEQWEHEKHLQAKEIAEKALLPTILPGLEAAAADPAPRSTTKVVPHPSQPHREEWDPAKLQQSTRVPHDHRAAAEVIGVTLHPPTLSLLVHSGPGAESRWPHPPAFVLVPASWAMEASGS